MLGANKLGVSGIIMLAGMAALALVIALYAVPSVASASGKDETNVTWLIALLCLVIAVGATFWANKKNAKEQSKDKT